MKKIRLTLVIVLLASVFSFADVCPQFEVSDANKSLVVPYRGLAYTKEGIVSIRKAARNDPRCKAIAQSIFEKSRFWMDLTEEQVKDLLPNEKAEYAFGLAGDPKTDQLWTRHGMGGICSLDRPGTVKSPYTGDIYGNAGAGEDYYDPGDGWTRPSDGKKFYFKGIWNSYILMEAMTAVDNLALTYMLTGREDVAERALYMLDMTARLVPEYADRPQLDYTFHTPTKNWFTFGGNGANNRMYQTAISFDLLAGSPMAARKSWSKPEMTVFENIEKNFFRIMELSYKESMHTLTNHVTALYGNQLAQAILFGRSKDLRDALEVVQAWFDGYLTTDGQYIENSGGYERVGTEYMAMMLMPLSNYSRDKYLQSDNMPDINEYPVIKFADNPRWLTASVIMKYKTSALGRRIKIGDDTDDRDIITGGNMEVWEAMRRANHLKMMYHQTDNLDWKKSISKMYWELKPYLNEDTALSAIYNFGMTQWLEPPKIDADDTESLISPEKSDLLIGKRMCILRSGAGENRRAVVIRGGVNLPHSRDDQMTSLFYGNGMCLNGLFGYRRVYTPVHAGWTTRAASHNSIIINKDLPPASYPYRYSNSGNVEGMLTNVFVPSCPAQFVEMSGKTQWAKNAKDLSFYNRMLWLVDINEHDYYFVEIARIAGGKTHDYFMTSQWYDSPNPEDGFGLANVKPEPVKGVWTLAGFDDEYKDSVFDEKGKSWTERIDLGNQEITGDEEVIPEVQRSWNPPPGNGYGFIYDVKREISKSDWAAYWKLVDKKSFFRTDFLNPDGMEVITGKTPTLEKDRFHNLVVARRQDLSGGDLESRFIAVSQVAEDSLAVESANFVRDEKNLKDKKISAIELKLKNGEKDMILVNSKPDTVISAEEVKLKGARAFVRFDKQGKVKNLLLSEGTDLAAGHFKLSMDSYCYRGKITHVHTGSGENKITVNTKLPEGARLSNNFSIINADSGRPKYLQYVQNEPYLVRSVESLGSSSTVDFGGDQSLICATVQIEEKLEKGRYKIKWPVEVGGSYPEKTSYFRGRKCFKEDNKEFTVQLATFSAPKEITVAKGVLVKGDRLCIQVAQENDMFYVPCFASLVKTNSDTWLLNSNQNVNLEFPVEEKAVLCIVDSADKEIKLAESQNGVIKARIKIDEMSTGKATLRIRPNNSEKERRN